MTNDPVEIHDNIQNMISKIILKCYDLYGPDVYEEKAKVILETKNTDETDVELNSIIREYIQLEEESAKINPWNVVVNL